MSIVPACFGVFAFNDWPVTIEAYTALVVQSERHTTVDSLPLMNAYGATAPV